MEVSTLTVVVASLAILFLLGVPIFMSLAISSAIASIMMGLYANHPIALAPAMGENFFFSFVVIVAMGVPSVAARPQLTL